MSLFLDKVAKEQLQMKEEIEKYIAGDISSADLKHSTAPLGIYQQKNGLFMLRVRIPGGEISCELLDKFAQIAKKYDICDIHLTTRQDIQVHNAKVENVYNLAKACTEIGLIFRGGGGNTFRNIIASYDTGASQNEVFDIAPYVKILNDFSLRYDKAFDLPRKLKIGFSNSVEDNSLAKIQDLGFIAKEVDGVQGFSVYLGGGMGRSPSFGIEVFDFVEVNKILKIGKATIDFFFDFGDRENRNKARLRFVAQSLGAEKFKEKFLEYYEKQDDIDIGKVEVASYANSISDELPIEDKDFELWKKRAVTNHKENGFVSIKAYIPNGNLTEKDLMIFAQIAKNIGNIPIRFTIKQNIYFVKMHKSQLSAIYAKLKNDFSEDFTGVSFKGQITSCIGSTVCKIGILDAAKYANILAESLDAKYKDKKDEQADNFQDIINGIRISGCQNSCAAHLISKIGLQGMKKDKKDSFKVFKGGCIDKNAQLAKLTEEIIEADKLNYCDL